MGTLVVKDLSRFGRNYLQVGYYTEILFPKKGVRFIAMKDIRYWVSKVLTPEQSEVEKKPEPKHSVTEKMKFLQE